MAIAGGNGDGVRCTNGAVTVEEVSIDDMGDDGVDVRDCDATLTRVALRGAGAFGVRALRRALVIRSSVLFGNANGGLRTHETSVTRRWLDEAPVTHRGWEWRYLDRLADLSLRSQAAHAGDARRHNNAAEDQ